MQTNREIMENIDQPAMCSTCADEPAPNQLTTSQDGTIDGSHWAYLPSLILTKVFTILNEEDRKNASLVCKSWRETYFQPRFWRSPKIVIDPDELDKCRFLSNTFGSTVTYANIDLKSVSAECLRELINLLRHLASNYNLKELVIVFSPDDFVLPYYFDEDDDRFYNLAEVTRLLKMCLPRLTVFTADCMGALSLSVETIIKNLNPSLITSLGLSFMTSVSEKNSSDLALFTRLTKLEVLCVDQHLLTDELLEVVESCTWLKKLIVYRRTYSTTQLDSGGRPVTLDHSLPYVKSRRLVQLFRSLRSWCLLRPGRSDCQETLISRSVLFNI